MTSPITPGDHYLELSNSGGTARLYHFSDDAYPVQILQEASFEYTPLGVPFSSGPVRTQKRLFTISAYVSVVEWEQIENIFNSFDERRARGNLASVTIIDALLSTTKTYQGFFTSPPVLQKVASGNNTLYLVVTTLSEI